jgi:hypothetical protein
VHKLFESMHDTDGTQARIANGSFMTPYRSYPMGCKFYDEALHDSFQGDLFVASAGNSGFDETTMQSKQSTIGNPASCKNTLAGKCSYRCLFDPILKIQHLTFLLYVFWDVF